MPSFFFSYKQEGSSGLAGLTRKTYLVDGCPLSSGSWMRDGVTFLGQWARASVSMSHSDGSFQPIVFCPSVPQDCGLWGRCLLSIPLVNVSPPNGILNSKDACLIKFLLATFFLKAHRGAWEIAQWLKTLALAEVPDSVPRTNHVAHSHPWL